MSSYIISFFTASVPKLCAQWTNNNYSSLKGELFPKQKFWHFLHSHVDGEVGWGFVVHGNSAAASPKTTEEAGEKRKDVIYTEQVFQLLQL